MDETTQTALMLNEFADVLKVFFEQLKLQMISKKEHDERIQQLVNEYSEKIDLNVNYPLRYLFIKETTDENHFPHEEDR